MLSTESQKRSIVGGLALATLGKNAIYVSNTGDTPLPRSIEIIILARKCKVISWNQEVAGKILTA
jgi:hypothetical protein